MSKKALTLSIVIPVYNEENYLKNCLDSIARQTQKPYEVIIVDNNSTDNSIKIAKNYLFAKIINEPKQGIAYARDKGFNAASGVIIGRIDGDTVLPDTWVARVKEFYASPDHHSIAITGGGYFYNCRFPRLAAFAQHYFAFYLNRLILGHHMLWGSNMALPKSMWAGVKKDLCYQKTVHEDLDLGIHLRQAGFVVSYRRQLKVGVVMKRVFSSRGQLMSHLRQWPYTFRLHDYDLWALSWVGVLVVYASCYLMLLTENFINFFKPLKVHATQDLK